MPRRSSSAPLSATVELEVERGAARRRCRRAAARAQVPVARRAAPRAREVQLREAPLAHGSRPRSRLTGWRPRSRPGRGACRAARNRRRRCRAPAGSPAGVEQRSRPARGLALRQAQARQPRVDDAAGAARRRDGDVAVELLGRDVGAPERLPRRRAEHHVGEAPAAGRACRPAGRAASDRSRERRRRCCRRPRCRRGAGAGARRQCGGGGGGRAAGAAGAAAAAGSSASSACQASASSAAAAPARLTPAAGSAGAGAAPRPMRAAQHRGAPPPAGQRRT